MAEYFPWYNVNKTTLWKHDRSYPDNMLPDAVLPPNDDHTYAQWLEREENSSGVHDELSADKSFLSPMKGDCTLSGESTLGRTLDVPLADSRRCAFCGEFGDQVPTVRSVYSLSL